MDVVPLISIETTVVLRADPSECSEFIPSDATSRLKIHNSKRAFSLALGSTLSRGQGSQRASRIAQATRDLAFDAIKVDFVGVFSAGVVSAGRCFLPVVAASGRQSKAETQD